VAGDECNESGNLREACRRYRPTYVELIDDTDIFEENLVNTNPFYGVRTTDVRPPNLMLSHLFLTLEYELCKPGAPVRGNHFTPCSQQRTTLLIEPGDSTPNVHDSDWLPNITPCFYITINKVTRFACSYYIFFFIQSCRIEVTISAPCPPN
jgi:hypothetical protein